MAIGLVGKKCGMTRIFKEDGVSVPVTVVEVLPNRVVQVKSIENEGYQAVQVTIGQRSAAKLTKAEAKHFAKAGIEAGCGLWELRFDGDEVFKAGDEIKVDGFTAGQYVDVSGITKGKGFAGSIKRWNFSQQRMTHGNSLSHRAPGSIGQNQTPGRVFKGKKMAGRLGSERCTSQSLEIVRVDSERNLLLVKGAVPGANGGHVIVKSAIKKRGESHAA
ncbi:MAG: 50S ribosomal protein L3 [Gammaproteobacteria bacterium]|nr:50S ribosomal protein L3 [Gammaproteobacteria bacterium]